MAQSDAPALANSHSKTSPKIIRFAAMQDVRIPLSPRHVEDLLHERGIEVSHETVRSGRLPFGPTFAAVHFSVTDPVNADRSLSSRRIGKAARTAALVEWRALGAG